MTSGTPSRRAILLAGLGAAGVALTGCYRVSPLVGTGTRAEPSATAAPPDKDRRAGLDTENGLRVVAEAAGLSATAAVHRAHATVLAQADPLAGRNADTTPLISAAEPPSPGPSPAAALVDRERAAATTYATVAGRQTDPGLALLWASMSVFSANVATTGPAPAVAGTFPVRLPPQTVEQARQVLLSRLNALSAGLEWGIGRLDPSDPLHATGTARLSQVDQQRARLRAALRSASATPVPAQPGYPMPATPSTTASTRQLWAGLELGVLAGWGRMVAAAGGSDRASAIGSMNTSARTAMGYGAALPGWPGWV